MTKNTLRFGCVELAYTPQNTSPKTPLSKEKWVQGSLDSIMTMCVLVAGSDCVGSTSRDFANQFAEPSATSIGTTIQLFPVQQYGQHKKTNEFYLPISG